MRSREWWRYIGAPDRATNPVPDRNRQLDHRRRLAASGPLPPEMAAQFTCAELAVLKIVADEVARDDSCRLTKGEIADRSKACKTVVNNSIRKARVLGFISVKARPRPGMKNLPNLIRVIDARWQLWITHHKYRAIPDHAAKSRNLANIGCTKMHPLVTDVFKKYALRISHDQEAVEMSRCVEGHKGKPNVDLSRTDRRAAAIGNVVTDEKLVAGKDDS
jgi:hypothetical protein